MDKLLRKNIKRYRLLMTEIVLTGDAHIAKCSQKRPEKSKKGDIFLYECTTSKNNTHVRSLVFNGNHYKNIDLFFWGIEKYQLTMSSENSIDFILHRINSLKGSIAMYRKGCYKKKVSQCYRCGYCCIDYDVVILKDGGNDFFYKQMGLPCPNLRWDSQDLAFCSVHDQPWFIETPCFTYKDACDHKQCNAHKSRKGKWYQKYYREFSVEEYSMRYDEIAEIAAQKKSISDTEWFNPDLTPTFFPS